MKKPSILVDSMEIGDEIISVEADVNSNYIDYKISRNDFEAFIDRHDKRDYCYDSSDYRGEHVQDAGSMSWDQYYESGYVKGDMAEFIAVLNAEVVFDEIDTAISKIIIQSKIQTYASSL